MSLFEYYKSHLYEYAYNKGYDDCKKNTPNPMNYQEDIYWNDEMDYCICADYHSSYEFMEEDEAFLKVLGFETSDFEDYYG